MSEKRQNFRQLGVKSQHLRNHGLLLQLEMRYSDHPLHNADTLAAALNMSPRSLHRQLQEEGASLQQLKDKVRFERAKDLLLRTTKPIKQVAAASGFKNEKSFMRAFRAWTDLSPSAFRMSSFVG